MISSLLLQLNVVDQKGNCPSHAYLTPTHIVGGAFAVPDSTVANLPSAQFNHFDSRCDDECDFIFKKKDC